MNRTRVAVATAALVASMAALTGCSAIEDLTGSSDEPSASASASPSATPTPYESQFTRDGTFQSHIDVNGVDFVYTLYPTKSTPRTNEWYPKGRKYFSFTFQGYDLDQDLRDPFNTKRKVWLERIEVTSTVKLTGGGTNSERPYELDAVAKNITFDPQPLSTKYGMLVTSPKGAFELRNQAIRPTAMDTKGIDLHFTATVWIQERAGSNEYYKKTIKQTVPIAIFPSKTPTQAQSIPVDAN
ncbi:hypothetical protein [Nocardioides caricicola]|uniref:Lipoprotein n=1 Tax=Nocardioides caricicola TaxID=634770 RepID=A0ABW0N4N3_9ACTN